MLISWILHPRIFILILIPKFSTEYENFITKKDKEFQHLFFNSEILITQAIETMKDKFKKYAIEIKSSIEKIQKDPKQTKNCEALVLKYDNLKNLNEELIKAMLKRSFLIARLAKLDFGESTKQNGPSEVRKEHIPQSKYFTVWKNDKGLCYLRRPQHGSAY